MAVFLPTERDKQLIQETIRQVKQYIVNTPSRPPMERSWDEAEDHQAPEVYIAKPTTAAGIPPLTPARDVAGTGTGTAPECDAYDSPGSARCSIYKIQDTDNCGPALFDTGFERIVYNLSQAAIGQEWLAVKRDKFGRWIADIPAGQIIGAMLAENHPGRGLPFLVWLGTWCPAEAKWRYPCNDGNAQKYCAIDWRYDVSYPNIYAQGLFVARPYAPTGTGTSVCDLVDVIYECVSLDCSSDGNCANHALPCL